jgi:hypothetical protein
VETKELWLTKRSERLKVNCGTVLRTRMNIDDFALENSMRFLFKVDAGKVSRSVKIHFESRRSKTHGKGNDKDSAGSPHGGEA